LVFKLAAWAQVKIGRQIERFILHNAAGFNGQIAHLNTLIAGFIDVI
jgi:hypothetical protein